MNLFRSRFKSTAVYLLLLGMCFLSSSSSCWADCRKNRNTKQLLITGCGRSGTGYMATLLQKSGYDTPHEHLGAMGCVSWPMAVGSLSPWDPKRDEKFQHTFHQVREPLHVITSWLVNLPVTQRDEWQFIRRHIPEILEEDSLIVHCAKYWYYWNLRVEKIAEWRYQIENIDQVVDEFESRSGLKLNRALMAYLPRNNNKWANTEEKITWKELRALLPTDLYHNLSEMALRYGYEVQAHD